eukprot:SAG31_NODE_201_length_20535_cov_15.315081_17_plen_85_part_00
MQRTNRESITCITTMQSTVAGGANTAGILPPSSPADVAFVLKRCLVATAPRCMPLPPEPAAAPPPRGCEMTLRELLDLVVQVCY